MKDHPQFPWDHFSDQPRVVRNKKLKRRIYRLAAPQYLKSFLLSPLLPFFVVAQKLKSSWQKKPVNKCIGLAVHVETECEGKTIVPLTNVVQMVEELGVKQLLVRIPLADADNLDTYIEHIDALATSGREVSVNLLQTRLLLEDKAETERVLTKVISQLKGRTSHIHVGSAYNRRKWAIYHFGEYFQFFQAVRKACKQEAPEMKLIGGAIIDFELPPLLESLFHFRRGKCDGLGLQLYVDRRGAPENSQVGFNFLGKINLIETMRKMSWKTNGSLWISEINWPLKDTGDFSPCKGSVLVDPQTQANYLSRSYLLAIASGNVRTCYWHQLVAPGYGLVDNRGEEPQKYPSFHAFKTLNQLFNGASVEQFYNGNFELKQGVYCLVAKNFIDDIDTTIQAYWSNSGEHTIDQIKADKWLDQNGEVFSPSELGKTVISDRVIYALTSS